SLNVSNIHVSSTMLRGPYGNEKRKIRRRTKPRRPACEIHPVGPGIDVLSKTTVARIAAERASGKPRALFAKERTMSAQSTEFILGHPEGEMDHLGILSRVFDKFTRRVFVEAGLRDGMRVLEIGSASGDVAMVAAEFVGPHGAVVGVEQSPEAVELATRHAAGRGLKNVTF